MIRTFIFDLDGTLVETEELKALSYARATTEVGLAAARDPSVADLSVLVLEARDRVGGRVLNHTLKSGAVVEVGGQWVGPTQERILPLTEEFAVGVCSTCVEGEHLLDVGGAVKRYVRDDLTLGSRGDC